jgi:hypothetical protein
MLTIQQSRPSETGFTIHHPNLRNESPTFAANSLSDPSYIQHHSVSHP